MVTPVVPEYESYRGIFSEMSSVTRLPCDGNLNFLSCLERHLKHSFLLVLGPKHPFARVSVQIVFRDWESF